MEPNPAYHYGQQPKQLDDHLYEEVDTRTTKCSSITHEEVQDPVHEKTNSKLAGKKQRGANVVLAIATVAVLALAMIATIVLVLLTSNSNQEIQSLQLEIENLREMLNQTGDSLALLRTDNQARDCKYMYILQKFNFCACLLMHERE